MRTEVELVLLGQTLLGVTFPVHKATLVENFRTKSKTLHPDKGGNERGIPYKRPYTKYTPTWPAGFLLRASIQNQ